MFRKCITRKDDTRLYVHEKRGRIKLDLSTNPLEPDINVGRFLKKIKMNDLHHYPENPELPELKKEIAKNTGLKPENVMLTVGADQAIEIVLTHLLDSKDKVAIKIPTFPRFEIVAKRLCDANVVFFKDLSKIPKCKVVILCSPNNPTTEEINKRTLINILQRNKDKVFVLDSVFAEFGTWLPFSLVKDFDNLIIISSLSKVSLAGMRIGFILSSEENIQMLKIGVSPFRVPILSQKVALEAIRHKNHILKTKKFLENEWKFIKSKLPSAVRKTNVPFFILKTKNDSMEVCRKLMDRGISVVDGKDFRGLEGNWIRVAIVKGKYNRTFINEFLKIDK